jgi:hypothetical protein
VIKYTGWYLRNRTAVLQFKDSKDELSPELVEYCGAFETSKAEAKRYMKIRKMNVLKIIQEQHPKFNINNVVVE